MKYSIRLKISILFITIFALICVLFVICLTLELNSSHKKQNEYHESIIKSLVSNYTTHSDINITNYLLTRGFRVVENPKLAHKIKEKGKYYFKMVTDFGLFSSISYDCTLFLEVMNQEHDIIFNARENHITFEFIIFGFLLSLGFVFILYLSIMNSLSPLEKLRKQITQTTTKDSKNFLAKDYKNDEIGEIATEFSDTINRIHELVQSRQLFLRTIMHEFKTPIGKGRIIAEMIKEKKQKERLVAIFKRLDVLIEESAKIESLYSKNYKLQIRTYHFDEVLSRAKELLLYDDFDKKVKVKKKGETLLKVDIDTFALVLKNLIENAIKYSDDKFCIIECFEDCFIVKNKGKPLKQPYTEYLKPFIRDKDNQNEGMGLGLYIVDKTCKSHNFPLSYEYNGSMHCFKIMTMPPPRQQNSKKQKTTKKSKTTTAKKQNAKRQRINNEPQK